MTAQSSSIRAWGVSLRATGTRSTVYPTLSALRLEAAIEGDGVTGSSEADAGGLPFVTGGGGGGDRPVRVGVAWHESAAQLVMRCGRYHPNNAIAAAQLQRSRYHGLRQNFGRIDKIIARSTHHRRANHHGDAALRVDGGHGADHEPLLAESGQTPGAVADPQQRITLVADPRSNSILVRAENSVRMARVRSLLEQLDTQGRAGGNIFIIYLKNAEAIRVAATLRSLLTGSGGDPGASGGLSAAALGATSGSVGSRDERHRGRGAAF
jgi:general secretion pathway protein D